MLDDAVLDGVMGIKRELGPDRHLVCVNRDELEDAVRCIESLSQTWGGASGLLVPVSSGAARIDQPWKRILEESIIDSVHTRDLVDKEVLGLDIPYLMGGGRFNSLLPVVVFSPIDTSKLIPIKLLRLRTDDPWFVAYAGILGLWPKKPDTRHFEYLGLRSDVDFANFVPVEREVDLEAGAEDLLTRLRDARSVYPAPFSLIDLETRVLTGTLTSGDNILPTRYSVPRAVGPSIAVIYEPGSVDDLCLLWNLRWMYGVPHGAPLGVPVNSDVTNALIHWANETAFYSLNFSGSYFALTSCSVAAERLQQIADAAGRPWRVVDPADLVWQTDRAARSSADVVVFQDGRTRVSAWHPTDRSSIGYRRQFGMVLHLNTRITLDSETLPAFKPKEPSFAGGSRGGGLESPAGDPQTILQLDWPSGWDILEALARERGLTARPSSAGRVAASFLRHVGSISALRAFLSPALVRQLYRLGERKGSTRFKRQIREMARKVAAELPDADRRLQAIEDKLDQLALPGAPEERWDLTFDGLNNVFDNHSATRAWLTWAERTRILLKGLPARCQECGRKSWQSVAQLTLPILCQWCGAEISEPFPERSVTFQYVASEALLAVVGEDALPHLLALRWLGQVLRHSGPSSFYGAYPGAEFHDQKSGQSIGEADVLLVFSNGDVVPGECKLRGTALVEAELQKLDALTDRLGSPWSFIATMDWADDCPPEWREAEKRLPDRPRFSLTGEHLFEPIPVWPLDTDVFALNPKSQGERDDLHKEFVSDLPRLIDVLVDAD